MRVLFLTWEFPPLIAGGLGTACYGMVKALLKLGIEVDLILPTAEKVYFPLRRAEDADTLPAIHLEATPKAEKVMIEVEIEEQIEKRLKLLGVSGIPESYLTPGFSVEVFWEYIKTNVPRERRRVLGIVEEHLKKEKYQS